MAGFKTFVDFTTATAADFNGYLMSQTVPRFASISARNTAIPAPVLGQMCHVAGLGVQLHNGTFWTTPLPDVPVLRYYSASGQTFPNATWRRVNFGIPTSAAWTTVFTSSGTVFTCVQEGVYQISSHLRLASTSGSLAYAISDGTGILGDSAITIAFTGGVQTTGPVDFLVQGERDFSVSDSFAVWAYQNSGATETADHTFGAPWINIRRIG